MLKTKTVAELQALLQEEDPDEEAFVILRGEDRTLDNEDTAGMIDDMMLFSVGPKSGRHYGVGYQLGAIWLSGSVVELGDEDREGGCSVSFLLEMLADCNPDAFVCVLLECAVSATHGDPDFVCVEVTGYDLELHSMTGRAVAMEDVEPGLPTSGWEEDENAKEPA